ncbi:endoglucanase 3 precursor [Phlyctema vagabunda]|uniref:cellulase n=1 Tax=Phlyctema vagabunda TaxID=108571 RepID=A0ABR4PUE4_9HELO
MKASQILSATLLAASAQAQQPAWAQCGGQGYSGATTCVSGYTCTYSNPYYSQCIPGSQSPTTTAKPTTAKPTTTSIASTLTTSTTKAPAATGLQWLGINESGAEFGQNSIPGVYGTDFIFPANSAIDTLVSEGFNVFRVPFMMERLALGSVGGSFSQAYLANYSASINYITSKGAYAIVDPHNFGRYNGAIISDVSAFKTFWVNLATAFKSNSKVIFDTNNEYHDMDQTLVLNLNQAAIDGIRSTGATSQTIFVEGNSYSGAWTWTQVNDNLKALTDPQNKLVYEMHQYLDTDGSGTSSACVSSTIGAERVQSATAWLKANGKVGIIGEFAGGANDQCLTAVKGLLDHLKANSDVWKGAIWWGGGPWWGSYIYGYEPPSSTGYNYYDTTLRSYVPK